jgi:hypothetical protein
MMSYMPLGESRALSFGSLDFPVTWPVIAFATAAIGLLVLVFVSIVITPRHGARHAHVPRHAKADTASITEARDTVNGVAGDSLVYSPSRHHVPAEAGPRKFHAERFARN